MFKTLLVRRSILLTSLFSLSLPSFATPTLDLQMFDHSLQTLRSQPVKGDSLQDKGTVSYLTTLGRVASTAVDALANGVVKAYGFYTIAALPVVTALDTNLRANAAGAALMPMSELDRLTQENCLRTHVNPSDCDDLFGQYTFVAARYSFLPQLSYIEMESTTQSVLQTVRKSKTTKSKYKSYKSKTKVKDDYKMGVEIQLSKSISYCQGELDLKSVFLNIGWDVRKKVIDFDKDCNIDPDSACINNRDIEFRTSLKNIQGNEQGLNEDQITLAIGTVDLTLKKINDFLYSEKEEGCVTLLEDKNTHQKLTLAKTRLGPLQQPLKYKPQSTHQFPIKRIHDFFEGVVDHVELTDANKQHLKKYVQLMTGDECPNFYFSRDGIIKNIQANYYNGIFYYMCHMKFDKIWNSLPDNTIEKSLFYLFSHNVLNLFYVKSLNDHQFSEFIDLKQNMFKESFDIYSRISLKTLVNKYKNENVTTLFRNILELVKGEQANAGFILKSKNNSHGMVRLDNYLQWILNEDIGRDLHENDQAGYLRKDDNIIMEIRGYTSVDFSHHTSYDIFAKTIDWFFKDFPQK